MKIQVEVIRVRHIYSRVMDRIGSKKLVFNRVIYNKVTLSDKTSVDYAVVGAL